MILRPSRTCFLVLLGALLVSACGGGSSQTFSTCGNGRLDSGESCDDDNLDDHDACTTICQPARCGDGVTYRGVEDCDGPDLNGGSCAPLGLQGNPGCDASCRYDYSTCGPPIPTPTPTATPAPPTATPTATPGARCGDGLLSGDETCDSCGADCTPQACDPSGATALANVTLSLPADTEASQIRVSLAYRTSVVSLPSAGLQARFQPSQSGLVLRPTDKDYLVEVAVARTGGLAQGPLFAATFDRCAGAAAPTGSDFACTVTNCAGATDCTCSAEVP